MSFLPWLLLAVLGAVVLWVVMRQNNPLPSPGVVDPRGQPMPVSRYSNPQAQNSDAATATAVASAVSSAFSLVTALVNANSDN